MNKFEFLELIGEIDDELIDQAGKEWTNKKKRFYIGAFGMKAACAVLVITVLLGSIFHTQVTAAWEQFTTRIAEILGIHSDLEKYTEHKDLSITKNGYTMALKEVILADHEILMVVSCTNENNDPLEDGLTIMAEVSIDNQKLNSGPSSVSGGDLYDTTGDNVFTFTIDDHITFGDEAEVKAMMQVVEFENFDKKVAEFAFDFTASKEELGKNTLTKSLNQRIKVDGVIDMKLDTLTLNDVSSRITGECPELLPDREYAIIGEDDLGNTCVFELRQYENPDLYFVKNKDDVISAEATSLELQLHVRIISGEVVEIEILDDGEFVGEEILDDMSSKYEPVGEKFVVELDR